MSEETTENITMVNKGKQYTCPVHGNKIQGKNGSSVIYVRVQDDETIYCMLCWKDWLDKNISQVKETKDGPLEK
jgi:Pyruvate/2-oxoacid:ferredoxin oxidoreductase delta subunit